MFVKKKTLFLTNMPVSVGEMIPGIVPNVLDIPIITLAYCGAISSAFTLKYYKFFAFIAAAILIFFFRLPISAKH